MANYVVNRYARGYVERNQRPEEKRGAEEAIRGIPSIERLRDLPNEDTAIWVMELRRRMNATTDAMAKELGVTPYYVSGWQSGLLRPTALVTETVLTDFGERYGMCPPPPGKEPDTEGVPGGPRFARGLERRYEELFGA